MIKPIIITSLKIKKPGQVKSLRELCKYLQYRDGSVRREAFLEKSMLPRCLSDYIAPQHRQPDGWIGHGRDLQADRQPCLRLAGRRALARTWVISPDRS